MIGFFPYFLIEFKIFFLLIDTFSFLFSFPLSLESFFYKAITSNTYILVKGCVLRERAIVMA